MPKKQLKNKLRSHDTIYLVGNSTHQIVGAKLPSNRQALQVFFYNKSIGLNETTSARLVIDEVIIFWQKARVPTSAPWYCAQKLMKLYEKWNNLRKSSYKKSEIHLKNESEFISTLDDLFDIAATDALTQMKVQEDRNFLIAQRRKGREGCLLGVDQKGQKAEEKRQERIDAEEKRRKKAEDERNIYSTIHYDFGEGDDVDDDDDLGEEYKPGPSRRVSKNKKNIYTSRLIGALDKREISDRDAIHVISAVLDALDLDINDYILSHTSLGKYRSKLRGEIAIQFLQNAEVL